MKTRVLFVCMGNICRSPSAEAIFKKKIEEADLKKSFDIDSAGTISNHAGKPADSRMKRHATKRDISITSIARQVTEDDFENFDYIVAMDQDNLSNLKKLEVSPELFRKISMMTDYGSNHNEVPDPYYGGDQGFELVLNILDICCDGLLEHIQNERSS